MLRQLSRSGKSHRLGDLQLRVLKILWSRPETTVAEVHDALGGSSEMAYTTVATILRRMYQRGLVTYRVEGRTFIYRPLVHAEAVSRNMADDLLEKLFGGSLSSLLAHLLTTREISPAELDKIERLIAASKKRK